MKKNLLLLLSITAGMLFFGGCKNEEEVYNPECQISKIWQRSEVGEPEEVYHYTKKHLIDFIEFVKDEAYVDVNKATFEYNKDKTVSKITYVTPNFTEVVSFVYNENKQTVKTMTYARDGEPYKEVNFLRNGTSGKIEQIDENYESAFIVNLKSNKVSPFYTQIFGDESSTIEMLKKSDAKTMELYKTIMVTYDADYKNIVATETTISKYSRTEKRTFTYDDGNNPYSGLTYMSYEELPYHYDGLLGFSQNNVKEEYYESYYGGQFDRSSTITYKYEYNLKKFPRKITKTINQVPTNTYILYVSEK